MSNFKVIKRSDPSGWVNPGRKGKMRRAWYGQCPVCQEYIKGITGAPTYWDTSSTNTRKTAKDAVYRHMIVKHR
jgi:hypothetical protein